MSKKCGQCHKNLPEDEFERNLSSCINCVKKYLRQGNNFWVQYPTVAEQVDEEFRQEHPKLTLVSKVDIPIACPHCEELFEMSPSELLETGFCPLCGKYVIPLNAEKMQQICKEKISASDNYDEYCDSLQSFKPHEKGFIQECFAYLYFIIHANLFNISQYLSYSFDKIPKSLGLPKRDMGTDAVIIHNDETISLVQVKWRSKDTKHNRDALGGMCIDRCSIPDDKFKHLYLFTNVTNVKNLPQGSKFRYISYSDLVNMNWQFFKSQVASIWNKKQKDVVILPKLKYRKWQKEKKTEVEEELEVKDACTVVAPPGAGKTLLVYSLIDNYPSVLIIVPSLQLLSQWYYNFAIRNKTANYLLVASDHDDDINDVIYTLTTRQDMIQDYLDNMVDGQLIVICTYQSLERVAACDFTFNITFADEAHLTTGKGIFSLVTETTFPSEKKIFLTATPKIFKGGLKEVVVSMDNEEIYGKQFVYPCRQAITDKILCDYKVILGACENIEEGFPERHQLYAKFLCVCIKKYGLKRILVASNSHKSSREFYNVFKALFTDKTYELKLMKPNSTSAEKNEVLARIHKGPIIIFNVRIFNLGTDMPSLDSVMFNGDKNSKTDIIQTAFRCLRTCPDKDLGYILIPAFFGEDLKVDVGDFPSVRNCLAALGEQDSAIFDEVVLRVKNAKNDVRKANSDNRIEFVGIEDEEVEINMEDIETRMFDSMGNISQVSWMVYYEEVRQYDNRRLPLEIYKWCTAQRQSYKNGTLVDDRIKKLEIIKGWLWNPRDEQWEIHCEELEIYIADNGHLPPQSQGELGAWCNTQRQKYKNGKLSTNQISKLEKIDFWSWNPRDYDEQWEIKYKNFKKYVVVNKRLPTSKSSELCGWKDLQRQNYKNGKLSPDQIMKMEKIDGWSWDPYDERWQIKYKELEKYVADNGRLPTGNWWCDKQQHSYKKGNLSSDRIKKLEKINGWSWNPGDYDEQWKIKYKNLKKYVVDNKRLPTQSQLEGRWCNTQRQNYKNGKLSTKQITELEKINGWYWSKK
uniref:Helicase ATP-binding domain-containing protein n=1 Tax=viral metagenome TaxID=1070528 RepID=A0A6C0JRZ2_9ZZZZ